MRPIRLTLQAFGPFADRQVIDFRNSLDRRLFGFYGETGGGKTSVLDGMCFALFGESSGSERKGEDLRSHHVGSDIETLVEFVFEVGSKRYFVRRLPTQTVMTRRGGGETTRQHSAQMFDATGIPIEEISIENCGLLLAERVSQVSEKVSEVLGYLAPQFRQVVLLPQGQFRDLLTAKSDKRSEILRRLFDVSIYERLVEALKLEERALDAQVREARQAIGNLLSQHGVADMGALSDLIGNEQAERVAAEAERDRLNTAHAGARNALQSGQSVAVKFTEHANAVAAVDALSAKLPAIKALERRLSRAAQARMIVPLDARSNDKALALKSASDSLEATRTRRLAAEAAFKTASTALQESIAGQTDRDGLVRELTRLEEIETRVRRAVPLRQESDRLKREEDDARAVFSKTEKAVIAAEAALGAARTQESETQKRQTRIAELARQESEFTRHRDEAKRHSVVTLDVAQKKQAFATADQAWNSAKTALAKSEGRYLEAETALSKVQAVHLASKLVEGAPCSVCGSTHHPEPATGSAESQGLNTAFEDARTARQTAIQNERRTQSKQIETKALRAYAVENLAALAMPQTAVEDAEARLAEAQAELSALRAQPTVEAEKANLTEATAKCTQSKEALEIARASKDGAATASITSAQKLMSAFEGIEENLRSVASIAASVASARRTSDAARSGHEKIVAAEREAQRVVDMEQSIFREQTKVHETAAATAQEAKASSDQAIEARGWSIQDYAVAKSDIDHHDGLTREVHDFTSQSRSADDRLSRAKDALEGLTLPDLPALTDAAKIAEAAAQGAVERHAKIAADLIQKELTQSRCMELSQGLAEAEAKYAVVGELKDLTSGANSIRMSLVDYAIAATFEDVLEAANTRFTRMSRERFTLLRRTEMKDGRSRAGLDIVVHDTHTDSTRDAHTLSGGESFMAALSLALGLSDVVQQRAGGIRLDVIFIDEGFGSLDEQTLDTALGTLRDLVGTNRAVGVISHLEAVKQQIQAGFDISRGLSGSRVTERAR